MRHYEEIRNFSDALSLKKLNDQLRFLWYKAMNTTEKDIRDGSITGVKIAIETVDGQHIKPKSITADHLVVDYASIEQLDVEKARIDSLFAVKANVDDLDVERARITYLEANKANMNDLLAEKARIDVLEADVSAINNALIDKADITDLTAQVARIDWLYSNVATVEALNAAVANIGTLLAEKASIDALNAVIADINELQSTMITADALDVQVARIDWLYANTLSVETLSAEVARLENLIATKAAVIDLEAVNADVENLSASFASFQTTVTGNFSAISASIGSLEAKDATFESLFAGNITSEHIKTGSLTGDEFAATTVIKVGTGNNVAILTGQHPSYRFFVGHNDPTLAAFSVTQTGLMKANNAEITGKITATEGIFAGVVLVGEDAGINGDMENQVRFWSGGTIEDSTFRVYDTGLIEAQRLMLIGQLESRSAVIEGILLVGEDGILIDGNSGSISSANFASGLSGWRIDMGGYAEFSDVSVRGKIVSSVFVQNEIHAQGGSLLIRPAGTLAESVVYSGTGDIEILISDSGEFQRFAQDDILRVKDLWLRVKKAESAGENYKYTCTLLQGPSEFTLAKGETVVNMGQIGQGGIILTSSENNAPFMDVFENTATPWLNRTLKARIGNLSGIVDAEFGNLQGYGLYSDNAYLKGNLFLPNAGITNTGDIRLWAGSSFANRGTAPFRVLQDGTLYASKGIFEGEIRGAYGTFSGSVDVSNITLGSNGIFQIKDDNGENVVVGSKLGLSVYGEGFSLYQDSYATRPFLSVAQDDWRSRLRGNRISTWNVHRALENEPMERRNLLKNSTFNYGNWNISTNYGSVLDPEADKPNSKIFQINYTAGANDYNTPLYSPDRIYIDPKPGEQITFSWDFYCEDLETYGPSGAVFTFRRFDAPIGGTATTLRSISINSLSLENGVWRRIINTYTFGETSVPGWYAVGMYVSCPAGKTVKYKYREFKVEIGDRATVWSPAPEDLNPPEIDTHRIAEFDNGYAGFSFLQQNIVSDFDFEEKTAYKAPRNMKIGVFDTDQGKFLSYTNNAGGNFFFLGMNSRGEQDTSRKVKIGVNKTSAQDNVDIDGSLGVSELININKAQLIYRSADNGLDIIIYD